MVFSYLIGCFNTGYYYIKLFYKEDIRKTGTKVTGAANVNRIAGRKGFIITFLGDTLKGVLVVVLCRIFHLSEMITLFCILFVLAGHIFPVQLHFHGGKGISTFMGTLLVFDPIFVVFLIISYAVIYPFVKRSTITSLFAFILFPFELLLTGYHWKLILFACFYSIIILYACRSNMKDYLNKTSKNK